MQAREHRYSILPSYVETVNGERKFQKEMMEFSTNSTESILLVDAPTGAGKTRGFLNMDKSGGIVVILPNNQLADQMYHDLISAGKPTVMLSKKEIDKMMGNEYGSRDIGKLNALKDMISGERFIVTNPTIFLYLLLNYYGHPKEKKIGKKELDMAVFLYEQGFNMVIVDEFHVYSTEQIRIILSINVILRNLFKFVYSSATPTHTVMGSVREFSQSFNMKIREIKVPRTPSGNGIPVQGPLNISIYTGMEYDASAFAISNAHLLKEGSWIAIFDRITEIERAYKGLRKAGISKAEIGLMNGYHREGGFDNRIVLASNLVEQGINPPEKYDNIIMDAGHTIKNLMQRIGRIGRGSEKESSVFICINKNISEALREGITTYEELIEYLGPIFPEKESRVSQFSIGVVLGAIISKFTESLRDIVKSSVKENQKLFSGIQAFTEVSEKLSERSTWFNRYVAEIPELERIRSWWNDYSKTFYNFIEQVQTATVTDVSLGSDQLFEAKYNWLWIKSNKVLSELTQDKAVAISTKDEPDLGFDVQVSGVPFNRKMKFAYVDLLYNSRKIIDKALEEELRTLEMIDGEFARFISQLKSIVKSTSGRGRLVTLGEQSVQI